MCYRGSRHLTPGSINHVRSDHLVSAIQCGEFASRKGKCPDQRGISVTFRARRPSLVVRWPSKQLVRNSFPPTKRERTFHTGGVTGSVTRPDRYAYAYTFSLKLQSTWMKKSKAVVSYVVTLTSGCLFPIDFPIGAHALSG